MINDPITKTKLIWFRFRNEYSSTQTPYVASWRWQAQMYLLVHFIIRILYFRALTGTFGAQITIATSIPPWIRNNSTKDNQIPGWYFTPFVEQFYAIKLQIQGIIDGLSAAIIHNENNALCSHSVQTSPMNLFTNSNNRQIFFSEMCVHSTIKSSKQNGSYVFHPIP